MPADGAARKSLSVRARRTRGWRSGKHKRYRLGIRLCPGSGCGPNGARPTRRPGRVVERDLARRDSHCVRLPLSLAGSGWFASVTGVTCSSRAGLRLASDPARRPVWGLFPSACGLWRGPGSAPGRSSALSSGDQGRESWCDPFEAFPPGDDPDRFPLARVCSSTEQHTAEDRIRASLFYRSSLEAIGRGS